MKDASVFQLAYAAPASARHQMEVGTLCRAFLSSAAALLWRDLLPTLFRRVARLLSRAFEPMRRNEWRYAGTETYEVNNLLNINKVIITMIPQYKTIRFRSSVLLAALVSLVVLCGPSTSAFSSPSSGVSVSPTSISFGSVDVGTTSVADSVTVKNPGASMVSLTSVTISGTNAAAFADSSTCKSTLAAGASCQISVTFTPTTTGSFSATLEVMANATKCTSVPLSGSGVEPTAATPTFSLSSGTYTSAESVTISDATAGATIYYTTNGSTPTTSSAKYTGAITVSSTETLEAIATASGYSTSAVASATYTITVSTPTPAFVQAASSASQGTPTSLSLAFSANTQAGDLLLVAFDYSGSATVASVTDTQGNVFTQVGTQLSTPGGVLSQVYYAPNTKGGADKVTVTLSENVSIIELYLNEYSGIASTNPIDAEAGASGSAGAVSSGDVTTTVAGDIIYGYCLGDNACTVGSGFTARSTLDSNLIEDETAGAAGSYAATATANSGWTMQMVALKPASASSSDPPPDASLSSASLTFASQTVSSTSAAQSVTLSNTGGAALTITSVAISGTDPSDFAETNNCGSSVGVGASCTISVTFTPAASGSLTAALSITDNATGSPQSVTLTGTGASSGGTGGTGTSSPAAGLSPSSLTFGNQAMAITSSAQTITLTNSGTAALSMSGITFTGTNAADFAEVADTCSGSVAAGANCTIGVTFTPSLASSETATLSVSDNAASSPQAVSLSGTGIPDVILSWTASTSSGIAGYNIYRGTTSGGESSTPLNSSPIAGTSFTDTSVTAGSKYYYVMTAVSSTGTQSADSSEVEATVP